MRILAIIPARAGSKGIPNKNIRLINGRPLILYTIENAKKSKYITDIVVSSDSPSIQIIAKQSGINYKSRAKELSDDKTTLDEVIYDTAKDYDADYIVTMQPTSPTLSVETLDNAIQYCINNNLDTVISVINHPHLAWIDQNGKKKPAYSKRLNRQYLPPYFIETGAFVVSKKTSITKTSRFGEKVDIYEVSDDEAVDVDNFKDLKYVETILSKNKKIAMYVNGNNQRGVGHVYRVLELADEFYCKPDIFYDINQTERSLFGYSTHNFIEVDGIGHLFSALEKGQYDVVINDILATSIDYMIAVRKSLPNAKIINFEDDGEGLYYADLVINSLYQEDILPHVKSGEKYYIAPKLFMFYKPIIVADNVKRVFVSFGGADPQNYSDRILKLIKEDEYKEYEFIMVLGRAKTNVEQLMTYNNYPHITVKHDVDNIAEIMSSCDVGITSRGRTAYELAVIGVPSIVMAQNKREEKHGFICHENGFSYIGLNPCDDVLKATINMYLRMSKDTRDSYQQLLLKHDLHNGRNRVMNLINNI